MSWSQPEQLAKIGLNHINPAQIKLAWKHQCHLKHILSLNQKYFKKLQIINSLSQKRLDIITHQPNEEKSHVPVQIDFHTPKRFVF